MRAQYLVVTHSHIGPHEPCLVSTVVTERAGGGYRRFTVVRGKVFVIPPMDRILRRLEVSLAKNIHPAIIRHIDPSCTCR